LIIFIVSAWEEGFKFASCMAHRVLQLENKCIQLNIGMTAWSSVSQPPGRGPVPGPGSERFFWNW